MCKRKVDVIEASLSSPQITTALTTQMKHTEHTGKRKERPTASSTTPMLTTTCCGKTFEDSNLCFLRYKCAPVTAPSRASCPIFTCPTTILDVLPRSGWTSPCHRPVQGVLFHDGLLVSNVCKLEMLKAACRLLPCPGIPPYAKRFGRTQRAHDHVLVSASVAFARFTWRWCGNHCWRRCDAVNHMVSNTLQVPDARYGWRWVGVLCHRRWRVDHCWSSVSCT